MRDVDDLGNGLIRRWSTQADQAKIGPLLGGAFRSSQDEPPSPRMMDHAAMLMAPEFPFMGPGDFAVVEDTSKPDRPLVACTSLWRHRWSYAGIEFGVGRPEFVGTDAAYRNRGMVRALFEMVHERSAAEGHLVQAITGIPYFYRQFGYEYVLDLGGERTTYLTLIPAKKPDEAERYHLRAATFEDIPHVMALYQQGRTTSLVWHEADEAFWHHEIGYWIDPAAGERDATTSAMGRRVYMIVEDDNRVCGYCWLAARRSSRSFYVNDLQLYAQTNWQTAMPNLLRAIRDQGLQTPTIKPDTEPLSEISFGLGRAHPVYNVLGEALAPRFEPPYAWYLRVPDVPAFLQRIAPVLEERLAKSVLTGYTGELKFDFYRGGLRLQFEQGKMMTSEPWRAPTYGDNANGGCPPLVFLQLLFGYRSLADLRINYPDVWVNQDTTLLVNILFPAQPSTVYSL
ncbi:MAG: GNAT family N-acetyltransferase [Chloroflexi bacterium]|nr:GNAT family N-acetyltransferase [Chloroflexota bacterium]